MPKKNTKNQPAASIPPQPIPFSLVGRTVVSVRPLTPEEMDNLGWYPDGDPGTIIQLTGGILLWAAQDEESNGPGVLFCLDVTNNNTEYGIVADRKTKKVRYIKFGPVEVVDDEDPAQV